MVEKGVLHSAASSAFAASRAFFLLMPTRALQAVSFSKAPSARFIWYLCRVDGVDACSLIKDTGVAQDVPPLVNCRRGFRRVGFYLRQESPHLSRDRLDLDSRGALFALEGVVHVLRRRRGLLLFRGELGRRRSHYRCGGHCFAMWRTCCALKPESVASRRVVPFDGTCAQSLNDVGHPWS